MARIFILRIGHRVFRDSRVTTHVCLTARALGADGVIIADREDKVVESTIRDVTNRFGGPFDVQSGKPWKQAIREWRAIGGRIVHLTAYGLPLPKMLPEILDAKGDVLVIVGSEKMPGEIFKVADWNVSVTNQPMSEVAALAIFLDWFRQHREFEHEFSKAQVQIVPSRSGKKIQQLPPE
ncbi:tRNA (cytidine(56)-2'-O)-methyltransferase [Candidatus Bathyarchaeota archaeon]|nr:MAG: tRNA (cytidine(56)-2'-O)-methyltransferase [Candidatus Bathyarchaeota archaeon]TMI73866.1 MAG: tRNA (cytidine(56)-2'-O)-methyltransferase [Candidatus Bathyarchaeota archaeon]